MAAIGQGQLKYHKLFRVMQTVREMMRDRKYDVAAGVVADTFSEFLQRYTADAAEMENSGADNILWERMTMPCQKEGGGSAIVFFVAPKALTSAALHAYLSRAREVDCQRLILISASPPNALFRKLVDQNNRSDVALKVQVFELDDLCVNITKHELVPKHQPLEPHELQEVLQAYALQQHQLPRILATDPVAQYFGLERGQVVRIERKSMSAGMYVTYRQVV